MHLLDMPNAGGYRLVYADAPWKFETRSVAGANGKGADGHYPVMTREELKQLPVAEVAAPDAWLVMWTTWPHLAECFELARAWSDPANPWTYRSGGVWAKRPRGWRGDPTKWQFGTGYIFRSASEPILVFGRGFWPWKGSSLRNLWTGPIRAHSQKPDQVRDDIRGAVKGPALEMFARSVHPGWEPWGREVGILG